eukprot:TRINITY_DN17961_c0_g1_i2.p1 TRINITY_DN17961_c0_g1~~TRINITY_DN17961_c0_g1_i2.p1  ORF type:complete len:411 (-),score=65.02 TRINITY_DN17961_c0_g1_i2:453-1631(-)
MGVPAKEADGPSSPSASSSMARGLKRPAEAEDEQGNSDNLVLDVGANFGQSTERYLAAGYRVVAVEPNPDAAAAIRDRLRSHIDAKRLVVEETAVWSPASSSSAVPTTATLYINEEDSEWSSLYRACGCRYDTPAREVEVRTTTLKDLFDAHGVPFYLKIDVEGADGVCLRQLQGLRSPPYLSFELASLAWLELAQDLGYTDFKVVRQSGNKADHLLDEHGRPLTHAGAFGEAAKCCADLPGASESDSEGTSRPAAAAEAPSAGAAGAPCAGASGEGWLSLSDALALCRRLCIIHAGESLQKSVGCGGSAAERVGGGTCASTRSSDVGGLDAFHAGPPRYVERSFATLRACFPVESRNDEEWYDIHCRHSSVGHADDGRSRKRSAPERDGAD